MILLYCECSELKTAFYVFSIINYQLKHHKKRNNKENINVKLTDYWIQKYLQLQNWHRIIIMV